LIEPPAELAETIAFVRERRVLRPRERVLVAAGGGAASTGLMAFVALAREALALRSVCVVTVDDGSDEGSERCADAARSARALGLEIHVVEADREPVIARCQRLRRSLGYDALALGDTVEDAAARALRELMGERPVRGLAARRADRVCRPLRSTSIRTADLFTKLAGLEPPSSPDFLAPNGRRALDRAVREGILPRVRAFWPDADRALAELARRMRAQRLR
jgi:tRNA(Ile)-lysidine synthase TilS/MesJ